MGYLQCCRFPLPLYRAGESCLLAMELRRCYIDHQIVFHLEYFSLLGFYQSR
jgi:hypothetical protein